VVNEVYKVIVKKKKEKEKKTNTQESGKSQKAKTDLQKTESCLFKFR
jgi:hypothetical protein